MLSIPANFLRILWETDNKQTIRKDFFANTKKSHTETAYIYAPHSNFVQIPNRFHIWSINCSHRRVRRDGSPEATYLIYSHPTGEEGEESQSKSFFPDSQESDGGLLVESSAGSPLQ